MEFLLVAAVVAALAVLVYFFFLRGNGSGSESSAQDLAAGKARTASVAGPAPEVSPASAPSDSPPKKEEVEIPIPEAREEEPIPPPPPSRGPEVSTLRKGLARSRDTGGIFGRLKSLFASEPELDSSLVEALEEVLLTSDVGVETTEKLLARVRESIGKADGASSAAVWSAIRTEALNMVNLSGSPAAIEINSQPTVALFVGVNGAGKTTTIGKLATHLTASGHKCVLAAGDTFRAAAVQQLKIWGKRVGCEVVHGKDGADPGSVLFDAVRKAQELGADVVLADTAGRLHTKANLMNEMQKIARSTGKAVDGAPHETFLVLDATTGQNALAQAKEFRNSLDLTGIVLTKLDGTAKGGVVLSICDTLGVPVRYVGLGEGPDDLHEFHSRRFVDALLGEEQSSK